MEGEGHDERSLGHVGFGLVADASAAGAGTQMTTGQYRVASPFTSIPQASRV